MANYYKDTIEAAYKKLKKKLKRAPTRRELITATGFDGTTIDTYTKGKLELSKGWETPEVHEKRIKSVKETLKTKKYNRIVPTRYGDLRGPEKLKKSYLKEFSKRFKYPHASNDFYKAVETGKVLDNAALMKKYKLSLNNVERINAILATDNKLKYPKQTYEGSLKVLKESQDAREAAIRRGEGSVKWKQGTAEFPKGHAGNIYGKNLIRVGELIYTPQEINNLMAGASDPKKGVTRFSALDYRIKATEAEIEKIKKSNMSLAKKKIELGRLDNKLVEYVGMSDGYKIATLSDGTKYGESFRKLQSMDPMDIHPDKTEKGVIKFQKKWKNKTKWETAAEFNNIKKAQLFEANAKLGLANAVKVATNQEKIKTAIALGCVSAADGGRIGYALGSATINCINKKLTEQPLQSSMRLKVTEGIGKIKPAATNFLKLLGKGGVRAAPLAAAAAVGAGIEPLVKQFRIDDPTTYLTDESQMKGMLLATIEGETPKVDQEILKWQMPALGAATAAGAIPGAREAYLDRLTGRGPAGPAGTKLPATIPNKPVGKVRAALGLRGVLGKALGASFSPLAVAATTPLHIAAQRKGGTEWGDIATDPMNWMAPAFASAGAEMATRGMKPTGILAKAIRMGISPRTLSLISRRFGMPGLAVSAGMWGYDKWKNRSINDED